jgi:putative oxidoreductase
MQNLDTVFAATGRVLIAALFLLSGVGKIASPSVTEGYIAAAGLPAPLFGLLIAVFVEVGGGLLLIAGFRTRIVALVLVFHHNFADQNAMIHFFKNFAIIGGLLQIAAFGPGSVSLDARRLNFAHQLAR